MSIAFTDAAGYERTIGAWSVVAGGQFLDWLAAPADLHWLEVGCGSGAFTALLARRQQPASILGIDPSPAQLEFARARKELSAALLQPGNAMALPCADASVDAAVMALVLFFVPDPALGLAEMIRAVRPGGLVSAYLWDLPGGGFPSHPVQQALRRITGIPANLPPHPEVSGEAALGALWRAAGLRDVDTCAMAVERRFADFEAFWAGTAMLGSLRESMAGLDAAQYAALRADVRGQLVATADGGVGYTARATAVRGRKPD